MRKIYSNWRAAPLKEMLAAMRKQELKIVVANGVFDLLHPGHIAVFRRARYAGVKDGETPNTFVIAALNTDASAASIKGPHRPYLTLSHRLGVVSALRDVDLAVGFNEVVPSEFLEQVRPDFLVKGPDYKNKDVPGTGFAKEVLFAEWPGSMNWSATEIAAGIIKEHRASKAHAVR